MASFLYSGRMEYLSSIVFHTVILKKLLKRGKISKLCIVSILKKKIGVSIIDSIPRCHTENALKKGQKQEMWLRFYIVEEWSIYHR